MAFPTAFALFYSIFSLSIQLLLAQTNAGRGVAVATQLWCVAKNNAEDSKLQGALDWACGSGGADCKPIQQGGPCYDPADIQRTASYAFNDYFLKHGMTDDSCSFDNTAAVTSLNPSFGNCKFPPGVSTGNGSISGSTTAAMGSVSSDFGGCGCRKIPGFWFSISVIVSVFFLAGKLGH